MITYKILLGAFIGIFVLIVIILLIFGYLVINRKIEERRKRKIDAYISKYEEQWFQYLVYGNSIENAVHDPEYKAVIAQAIDKIFISYVTTLSNPEVQQHISNYASLNMVKYYKKALESKVWANRLNILRRILMFDLAFLVPEVERRLKEDQVKNKEEYLIVLRVMAKYNPSIFLAHLYKPRMKLLEYDYKVILSTIDANYYDDFMQDFEQLPIDLKLTMLDFFSLNSSLSGDYLTFLEGLLDSVYLEIRIRALKAISAFGMISALTVYQPFMKSQEWQERLMLAKILRFVNEEGAAHLLNQLVRDPNWNVRKQAALTLKQKRDGKQILQKIVMENDDQYATDIAKEVLAAR